MSHKTEMHRRVVESRWKARNIWRSLYEKMPESIEVLNNKDGSRASSPVTIDITPTVDWLKQVGHEIFVSNFKSHYVGVSLDNPSKISYANRIEHKHDQDRRMRTTIQRYLARNFEEQYCEMNERAIEMFVEKFKKEAAGNLLEKYFSVIKGRPIVEKYSEQWGGGTCMTGCDSKYTKMYAINDDVVSMLLFDNGHTKARALLWKVEDTDTGEFHTLCDRVYPNSGPHLEFFADYCAKKGYITRIGNSHPTSRFDNDECTLPEVKVSSGKRYTTRVVLPSDDSMPYLDTLHWGVDCGTTIQLFTSTKATKVKQCFCSTSGDWSSYGYPRCKSCTKDIDPIHFDEDNVRMCSNGYVWHGDCYEQEHFKCSKCECDCRSNSSVDVIVRGGSTEEWCYGCYSRYATACDDCGGTFRRSLVSEGDGGRYCDDCIGDHPSVTHRLLTESEATE